MISLTTEEAVEKVSCAEETPVYCLYLLNQGLQPSHQEGPIQQSLAEDWMPPQRKLQRMTAFSMKEPSSTKVRSCSFSYSVDGVYLHTRSGGNLFNLARLQVKTKVRKVQISEMLFANDAVLTAHTEGALKRFMQIWSQHQSLHLPRLHHLQAPPSPATCPYTAS